MQREAAAEGLTLAIVRANRSHRTRTLSSPPSSNRFGVSSTVSHIASSIAGVIP